MLLSIISRLTLLFNPAGKGNEILVLQVVNFKKSCDEKVKGDIQLLLLQSSVLSDHTNMLRQKSKCHRDYYATHRIYLEFGTRRRGLYIQMYNSAFV